MLALLGVSHFAVAQSVDDAAPQPALLIIHREIAHYPVPRCGEPSGQVVTRAIINPEGKVEKLTVISGPEARRDANLKALRQWTYKPYLLNGTAVWVQTMITINIDFGGCAP